MSRVTTRQEPNELMLRDILDLLRRQKLLIAAVMIVCIGGAVVQALVSVPVFRSSVQIMVEGRTPNSPQPDLYDPLNQVTTQAPSNSDIVTQMELLQSEVIVGQAFREAGLETVNPEVDSFVAGVTVEPIGQTNVLRVNVDSPTPSYCTRIATVLPQVFTNYVQRRRQAQVDGAIEFLRVRRGEERKRLDNAEKAMERFRQQEGVLDIDIERQMRADKSNRSDMEKVVAERDLYAAKARLDAAISARRALPPTQFATTTRSNTEAIEAQKKIVSDLVAQREQLLTRYLPSSQAMQKVDAELRKQRDYLNGIPKELVIKQEARNPLIDSYDTQVAEARLALQASQAAAIRMGVWSSTTSRGMAVYSKTLKDQREIQRAVDDAQSALNLVNRNLADLEVRAKSVREAAVTLSSPSRPMQVKPNWVKSLALAILVGLALAFAMAVIRDRAADRVVSVAETDQLVGALPLGYIPALPRRMVQSLAPTAPMDPDVKALPGQTMSVPEVALESYRILRANMAYSTQGAPVRSVLVTSTSPREGKTMVASNLAVALAADGKRVILVDCNLRRPALHQMFHAKDTPGLGDVLLGRGTLGDVLQPTSVPGLSLIAAGMETLSASELFGSPAMTDFHKELIENCDIAILDGAQCARVSDAQVLSSIAEGVLYVVQLGVPKKASMRFGIGLLKRANARILGVVYNRLKVNEDNAPQV
jgi:polysaccharide biosynthesis transport protein